jgi:hypothetical protein
MSLIQAEETHIDPSCLRKKASLIDAPRRPIFSIHDFIYFYIRTIEGVMMDVENRDLRILTPEFFK